MLLFLFLPFSSSLHSGNWKMTGSKHLESHWKYVYEHDLAKWVPHVYNSLRCHCCYGRHAKHCQEKFIEATYKLMYTYQFMTTMFETFLTRNTMDFIFVLKLDLEEIVNALIIVTFFVFYFTSHLFAKTLFTSWIFPMQFWCSILGVIALIACSLVIQSPQRFPDLWPVLVSIYSCGHFILFLISFNYLQFTSKDIGPTSAIEGAVQSKLGLRDGHQGVGNKTKKGGKRKQKTSKVD